MTFPFPGARAGRDATDDPDDAAGGDAYTLVGAPLDASTSFQPGARFGPDLVRRFAGAYDDYDRRTDSQFSAAGVRDAGDVRAWDAAADYLDHLTAELRAAVIDGTVPLVVGGEHTVSWAGVRATDPDVLVVVDAHLDLRDAYDGNPLSHACVTRRALDGLDDGDYPTVDDVVVVGARTGSRAEWERADRADVTVVPPEAAADWTAGFGDRDVYLSVDIDGVDPGFAPGTGTMEPFGLSPREARDVVRAVAPACVGFDAVEVNDRDDGQTAALAAKLLREFVRSHSAADAGAE
ncbi:agmatinase family protein [Candidatus Halobonum tyrrellensis]|uniref:Agmatinase n=1 Tax=Candidatus Halobonum tyrrellensis G22 TaxID=1324957 RepID=V4GQU0_9EURY|nr:agmatinase family protein [Candidatus Halobonum tyrrellensis]ESP87411.1 agmatinase [Candidatus Halobonum tyrrellensis G22]